jgi:HEPN superfamily protein
LKNTCDSYLGQPQKENLALRGLYWLALDIIGDEPVDQDSIAPEAAELKHVRNLLEHRSLVLREVNADHPMGAVETITIGEFQDHALHIVKLARSALMYLAFSMRIEEDAHRPPGNALIPEMELPLL